MSSKAITEKPEIKPEEWQPVQELAPSALRAEEPTVARWIGLVGLTFFTVGVVAHLFKHLDWKARIDTAWGTLFCFLGVVAMLYHATRDGDTQVRKTYGAFAATWLIIGIFVSLLPIGGMVGTLFLPWGALGLALGLLFLLPYAHHETDPIWRGRTIAVLGLAGAVLAGLGLIGGGVVVFVLAAVKMIEGTTAVNLLVPYGVVLALLGLAYLWAFIVLRGSDDPLAYRAGTLMAVAAFLTIVFVLARWLIPWIGYHLAWSLKPFDGYLGDAGLLVILLSMLYLAAALGLCSDNRFVVLTRRELASFFYSPIAYLVLFGFLVVASIQYWGFARGALRAAEAGSGIMEPVVAQFFWAEIPIIIQMLIGVPLLTMRLFAEEKRSGTYEVLLTAPVSELPVVLSKFTAALIIFLATWLPYWLYLLAFRIEVGQPFDYRPIESFLLGLIASGSAFMAMGLFFSSLTRNQIAAGVLSAMGVVLMIIIWGFKGALFTPGSAGYLVLEYMSFIDLWQPALQGRMPIGHLVTQLSMTVFWLFLTLKVLEARKWS